MSHIFLKLQMLYSGGNTCSVQAYKMLRLSARAFAVTIHLSKEGVTTISFMHSSFANPKMKIKKSEVL